MFDCNLIKSRVQKMQEEQLPQMPASSANPETVPIYPLLPPTIHLPSQSSPTIQVPSNPLLPPESRQTLDYESLQYLNGFLRTQIGKYVEVEFLVGTSNRVMRSGRLIGMGINYILLLDIETQDIIACDFYNIKFVKFYYRSTASATV